MVTYPDMRSPPFAAVVFCLSYGLLDGNLVYYRKRYLEEII